MITMSYGGGKQTVAMVTLVLEGKLPKPDLIVMADTGREVKTTWEYLDAVVRPALKQAGMTVEIAQHDLATDDVVRENGETAPTLQKRMDTGGNQVPMIGVRRLTPTECARLQGFPDDWNDWLSDSARYRQFGNAVAVPPVEWIAKRIRVASEM